MALFDSIEEAKLNRSYAAIGVFDGVHLGHQAVLADMARAAAADGAESVVITFHPLPAVVLRGLSGPHLLTTPDERARLITALGVTHVITQPFTRSLADLTAEDFMERLTRRLGLRSLWAGPDFALGRNRQGNIETLQQIGERQGFSVHVTQIVEEDLGPRKTQRISSSQIRELVRSGAVARAARLLGRPYALEGPVVHGDARGRDLGFPTANIAFWPGKIIPAYGVYATWVWVEGRRLPGVTSIGVRPTFDDPPAAPRLESFLINFSENLYGKVARVEFLEFLRPELRFNTVQALIDQMNLDTQRAKEVLAHAP